MRFLRSLLVACTTFACIAAGAIWLAGCASTPQIRTAPPRPATEAGDAQEEAAPAAGLVVVFEAGAMPLPEQVQALRFRVADLQFRQTDGTWTTYPADVNAFEVRQGGARPRKTVLATQLAPGAYDSLAVSLGGVYVEYGANAGGPLTTAHDAPVRLAFPFQPSVTRPATLVVTFEPGASLSRTPDCRWFFVPFLTATLGAEPPRP